ncbi:MAG: sugar transferase (PEP-CTERM/EpsH1 system associated) [Planctomycetota bacterium]|jgi:sugar transferase (PEP-CTERM/EpsH1 system associated)
MTIRVAHLVTSFDMGGLQNGIVNLINHGDSSRIQHTVLSIRSETGLQDRLTTGDVRSLELGEGRHTNAYKIIAKALKDIAPDILHTRNWGTYPDGILAARRAGVKRRIHGFHGRDLSNAQGESLKRRIMGKILTYATDRIITLTPSMKREYIRDYAVNEGQIEVIPNGIDLARMDSFDADETCRSSFTVVCVGRLDTVKNWPLLIRSFARMKTREPTDRLAIVGDGGEKARIEEVAQEAGLGESLMMLGARSDAPSVMKAGDAYVQPSFYEGMSNTIVEAMACGLAVVATDVGGNGDVAGREGTAKLVESDNIDAMADALDQLKQDKMARLELAAAGKARVIDRFGLQKMVDSYERTYCEMSETK